MSTAFVPVLIIHQEGGQGNTMDSGAGANLGWYGMMLTSATMLFEEIFLALHCYHPGIKERDMGHQDPKLEIAQKLRRFLLPHKNKILVGTDEDEERQATLRFLKGRVLPGRQVYLVVFEDEKGLEQRFVCYVEQDKQGNWQFMGATGGGVSGSPGPVVERAWASLDGGGMPNHFYAGGYVADHGEGVIRVRLIANNGTEIEDTVDDGIVLFLSEQRIELPVEAEMYDGAGKMVYRHRVLG
jgi:hypothetical protein